MRAVVAELVGFWKGDEKKGRVASSNMIQFAFHLRNVG